MKRNKILNNLMNGNHICIYAHMITCAHHTIIEDHPYNPNSKQLRDLTFSSSVTLRNHSA